MSERPVTAVLATQHVSADPDTNVGKITDLMLDEDVSTVLIVDETGRMIGIVSESTLLAAAFDPPRQAEPVSLYMQRDFVWVDATAPLESVIETFLQHHVRHLPVLDRGRPVGIVSRRRLLRALVEGGLESWAARGEIQSVVEPGDSFPEESGLRW